ncbi:MAG: NUDIX domain-containing protein [archaeon]|jgi:ADP-ribose pyrophosphatase YjhB (NUDIX family)
MEKLIEITDKNIGQKPKEVLYWKVRNSARAIVIDKEHNTIGLLHVTKRKYHTLPGGGINDGESILEGLQREILEEIGCKVKILQKFAIVIENRSHTELRQRSHIFVAELVEKGQANPNQEEIETESIPKWLSLDDTIKVIKKESKENKDYEYKFMFERDIEVLEQYKKSLKN